MDKEAIRDFYGRIIGWVETKPNGDKIIRDFYGKIKGRYDKQLNVTRDFYGKIIGRGDLTSSLIYSK